MLLSVACVACGAPAATTGSEGASESDESGETGTPTDSPIPDPPQSCVEVERVLDLDLDERLCRITATGIVSTWDTQTGQTVVYELVELEQLVELARFDDLYSCGVLAHSPEADRIWLSGDTWPSPIEPVVSLHILDGTGALLDVIEVTHEGAPIQRFSAVNHDGQFVLAGSLQHLGMAEPSAMVIQLRDADGETLWTRTNFVSPDSAWVLDNYALLRVTDGSVGFLGSPVLDDSFRISVHTLDIEDGAPRWAELLLEDGQFGPFSLGARTDADGHDRFYLGRTDSGGHQLTAHDVSGAKIWTNTMPWDELEQLWSTGVRPSDSALFEIVGGREIDDPEREPWHLIHRDFDGEPVCTGELEGFETSWVYGFELLGPTRALLGLRPAGDNDADELDRLAILRVGWAGN